MRRNRFKLFEIPTEQRVVRIWLNDGGMRIDDAGGERHYDGWATVEDIASELAQRALLPADEALSAAAEALRQWEDWLGKRRHQHPRSST